MSEQFDIVVVGSGAAGIAAAVCAARAGCTTLLLDKNDSAGGTGGLSSLTTLCGLFDDEGNFLNAGFSREFAEALSECGTPSTVSASFKETPQHAETLLGAPIKMGRMWVLPYRPEKFRDVAKKLFAAEPKLQTRWHTPLKNVAVRENRITSLNGIEVGAVIDCSGIAEVGRAAAEELLTTDNSTQAPSVIFPLENVERDLSSPLAIAQTFSALARAGLPPVSFMPGCDAGITFVKFTGPPADVPALLEFLQRHVPGFERCRTSQTEFRIARRAGTMIVGRYLLTGADVLGARKFPDAVARSNWPVEQWSANGKQSLRYLPPGAHYEIPARSLQAARTENLFMAGKSMSADVDAIASARVMGCCLATGAVAGNLAVKYLKSPRIE
jgi:FAD dependent oxidoreductase